MFIFKVLGAISKFGGKIVGLFETVADYADHLIHKKEYERRAKRRKIFWTVTLSVLGGILVVLFFPYRLIVKRNGDFDHTLIRQAYNQAGNVTVTHMMPLKAGTYQYSHSASSNNVSGRAYVYMNRRETI